MVKYKKKGFNVHLNTCDFKRTIIKVFVLEDILNYF